MAEELFEKHNIEFEVLTWPSYFPDLNSMKYLWDVLDTDQGGLG